MQTPKWKLFGALWACTIACWIFPYAVHRMTGFDVTTVTTGYPWNFTPFYAVAIFGGAFLPSRLAACALPTLAYAGVNAAILLLTGNRQWMMIPEVWLNYALLALFPLFGIGLDRQSGSPLVPALWRGFAASFTFFILSNFASFWFSYPKTLDGLVNCYYMALPFYGPTVASTLLFSLFLFSPMGVLATQPAARRMN